MRNCACTDNKNSWDGLITIVGGDNILLRIVLRGYAESP